LVSLSPRERGIAWVKTFAYHAVPIFVINSAIPRCDDDNHIADARKLPHKSQYPVEEYWVCGIEPETHVDDKASAASTVLVAYCTNILPDFVQHVQEDSGSGTYVCG
jgi:hypothetical protein